MSTCVRTVVEHTPRPGMDAHIQGLDAASSSKIDEESFQFRMQMERLKHGTSLQSLAQVVDVPVATLASYERGASLPAEDVQRRIPLR